MHFAEMGGDPHALLAGSPVTYDDILAARPLSTEVMAELFDQIAARGPRDMALRCGAATRTEDLGVVGYALRNSATIREMNETWVRYSLMTGHPLVASIREWDDRWEFTLRPRYPLTPRALQFCVETSFSSVAKLHSDISGHEISILQYNFPYPAPETVEYSCFGTARLQFSHGHASFIGLRKDLDVEIRGQDREVAALCDKHCSQLLDTLTREGSIEERLNEIFASSSGHLPNLNEAASALRISNRKLQRELAERGKTYRSLVDEFRLSYACKLLEDGTIDVKNIAYLVGFQDAGSFRRAFRSWTGSPVGHWRRDRTTQEQYLLHARR